MRQDAAKPRATDGRMHIAGGPPSGRKSRWRWISAVMLIAAIVTICIYAVWIYSPDTPASKRLQAVAVVVVAMNNETYLLDKHGHYVPGDAADLLRITGILSGPKNPPGSIWGDSVVETAAKIADLLQPERADFELTAIELNSDPLWPDLVCLRTRGGNQIIWGRNARNEPSPEEKLRRLRDFYRSSEYPTGPWQLDLRPLDRPPLLKRLRTQ